MTPTSSYLACLLDPSRALEPYLDHGDHDQNDEESGGHCRGIAQLVEVKSLIVDVVDGCVRGVVGPTLSHYVDQVKDLKWAQNSYDDDEEARGLEQGPGDAPKRLPTVGTVDVRRLVIVARYILQPCHEDNH